MKFGTGEGTDGSEGDGYIWVEVNGEKIWFRHSFEDKAVRSLVMAGTEKAMSTQVRVIKATAYNQGKRASRNREYRVTEFDGCINSTFVGYDGGEG